jgi:hypothetical protein
MQGMQGIRGRKPRFSAEQVAQALRASHGLSTHAAKRLGCKPHTILAYVRRHPICAQAQEEAREALMDDAEARLSEAIERGEPWAVTFALRTVGKGRGYVEKVEHSGGRQDKVIVEVVYSDDVLRPGGLSGIVVEEAPALGGHAALPADADDVLDVTPAAFRQNGRHG